MIFKSHEEIQQYIRNEINENYALACLERMEKEIKNLYLQRFGHDKENYKPEIKYPKYCGCGHVLTNKQQAYKHKKKCKLNDLSF